MLAPINDYLLLAAKNRASARSKFRKIYKTIAEEDLALRFNLVELDDGRVATINELSKETGNDYRRFPKRLTQDYPNARLFESANLTAGGSRRTQSVPFEYNGEIYNPGKGNSWKHSAITNDGSPSGMEVLADRNRLFVRNNQITFKRYATDFPYEGVTNWWDDFGGARDLVYVVQTNPQVVKRCLLMTTDPGDLVLDITCGSGTTAVVAEEWGRRWITCDSSRIALTLTKQRLMTSLFDYYQLAYPDEGCPAALHIRQPSTLLRALSRTVNRLRWNRFMIIVDRTKARVSGPFTVEAVPAPTVKPFDDIEEAGDKPADEAVHYHK